MKTTMWLVKLRDRIYCAYPKKTMAEVYVSDFSCSKDAEIIEGYFITEEVTEQADSPDADIEADYEDYWSSHDYGDSVGESR